MTSGGADALGAAQDDAALALEVWSMRRTAAELEDMAEELASSSMPSGDAPGVNRARRAMKRRAQTLRRVSRDLEEHR